jgi:hypothetical protein
LIVGIIDVRKKRDSNNEHKEGIKREGVNFK